MLPAVVATDDLLSLGVASMIFETGNSDVYDLSQAERRQVGAAIWLLGCALLLVTLYLAG